MAGQAKSPILVPAVRGLTRRDWLGFAARGAAAVAITQNVACAPDAVTDVTDDSTGGTSGSGTTGGSPPCVVTADLTEGPYFVDEKLLRSDIRPDPSNGQASAGAPLALTFNVQRVASSGCTPLTGAYLDVWHCDAAGVYSDVSGSVGRKFLRGYQVTDGEGKASFTTVYPGWYQGRAVHVHFELRLFAGSTRTYEFTSQFFFDEAITDSVYTKSPYAGRARRSTLNSSDGIYNGLSSSEKAALTLSPATSAEGYEGLITLGVRVT